MHEIHIGRPSGVSFQFAVCICKHDYNLNSENQKNLKNNCNLINRSAVLSFEGKIHIPETSSVQRI